MLRALFAAFFTFFFLLSQAAEEAAPEPLHWVGCGITKKAFMQELATAYEKKTGKAFQIDGGGATKGIRQVANLQADVGGSCRFKLGQHEKEHDAKLFPVAWDALAVIAHPENPVETVTLDQVRGIYLGEVTSWSELGGPNEPIDLAARNGKISGVGLTLRQLVFANEDMDFEATHFYPSSGPLEKSIEQNPKAIGITGISSARKRNVKILNLEGKAPDFDNIKSGEYLLYRPLYLVANINHSRYREIKKFVDYAHSREGREIIRSNGVVPYLEATHLVKKQLTQWKEANSLRKAQSKNHQSRYQTESSDSKVE